MLVRKLGVPHHEEFAMGAIADGNVQVLNEEVVHSLSIPDAVIADVIAKEHAELERRNKVYREGRSAPPLATRTVILVDDGCATGANMKAAVLAAAKQRAGRIVVAVPVASRSAYEMLNMLVDEVVCLDIPEPFFGVGGFYYDFSQTGDGEVKSLLKKARGWGEPNEKRKENMDHV
jgi:putative phosphoribosyl transferase